MYPAARRGRWDHNAVVAEADGRLFTAALVSLTLADLAYFLASGLLIGVTPFFVTGPLGSGPAGLGLALGAFSVTTLVLRPVVGRMADRAGRRPLLLAGAGLYAVLIAAHLLVHQLWLLILVRLLLGAAESAVLRGRVRGVGRHGPARTGWGGLELELGGAVSGHRVRPWCRAGAAWLGGFRCRLDRRRGAGLDCGPAGSPGTGDRSAGPRGRCQDATDRSVGDPAGTGTVRRRRRHLGLSGVGRAPIHRDGLSGLEGRPAGLWRHCGGLPNRVRPGTRSAASVASWGRLVDGLHRRPIHFEFDP